VRDAAKQQLYSEFREVGSGFMARAFMWGLVKIAAISG